MFRPAKITPAKPRKPKTARRKPAKRKAPPQPVVSHAPWFGYGKADFRRNAPLPVCPAARCRRVEQCLAAHDGLYCRRTHLSAHEKGRIVPPSEFERRLAALLPMPPVRDTQAYLARLADVKALRQGHRKDMKAKWKAGLFKEIYGPFRPQGVVIAPPPRVYVDEREGRAQRPQKNS